MQLIKRFSRWWLKTFRSQALLGKVLLGGLTLCIVCFACSVPIAIISPSPTPTSQTVSQNITPTVQTSETARSVTTTLAAAATTSTRNATGTVTANATEIALVVEVIDGDTIDVQIDGDIYRVRYIGVDTPERGDPFYDEASQANADLVAGQDVRLEKDVSETDRYNRLLRYVYDGDTMVNAALVRQGYARVATFPPDVKNKDLFLSLEREAREAGRGLWSETALAATPTFAVTQTKETTATPRPTNTPEPSQTPIPPSATPIPATNTPPPPTATPAPIGPVIVIVTVWNESTAEYIEVANQGDAPADLSNWHIYGSKDDETNEGDNFRFPSGYVLEPGVSVKIHSGSSQAAPEDIKWHDRPVWNNSGETAHIEDGNGNLVDQYGY